MNPKPVFNACDWRATANGRWEAQAASPDFGQPPPFEAQCRERIEWEWSLFCPNDDLPDACLDLVASGPAKTLAQAQRQADHAARWIRDGTKS